MITLGSMSTGQDVFKGWTWEENDSISIKKSFLAAEMFVLHSPKELVETYYRKS